MVVEHAAVVHLVDVIAAEDEHIRWLLAANGVDILVNRICSAHVPVGACALHGREEFVEFSQFLGHYARPAFADVTVERQGLVLRKDVDLAQPRIDAVGKRNVDDSVVATEGNCRFSTITREWEEPFAGAARKQNSQSVSHHRTAPVLSFFSRPGSACVCSVPASGTSLFSVELFPQAPLKGGEYHTQIRTAAYPVWMVCPSCKKQKTGDHAARSGALVPGHLLFFCSHCRCKITASS